jgi:hypothetical protein
MTAVDILLYITKHKGEVSQPETLQPGAGAGGGEVGISVAYSWYTERQKTAVFHNTGQYGLDDEKRTVAVVAYRNVLRLFV